jgi:hypothetical protein
MTCTLCISAFACFLLLCLYEAAISVIRALVKGAYDMDAFGQQAFTSLKVNRLQASVVPELVYL